MGPTTDRAAEKTALSKVPKHSIPTSAKCLHEAVRTLNFFCRGTGNGIGTPHRLGKGSPLNYSPSQLLVFF